MHLNIYANFYIVKFNIVIFYFIYFFFCACVCLCEENDYFMGLCKHINNANLLISDLN